jgi:hypothetical protein
VVPTGEGVIAQEVERQSARQQTQWSEPISIVAAEIHRGFGPAGISGGWPEFTYSSCVPTQHR